MDELLGKLYYSPKTGYCSAQQLYRMAKISSPDNYPTQAKVMEWLKRQSQHQITDYSKKRIKKLYHPIIGADGCFQIDLMMVGNYAKFNKGIHVIMVCVETLSRYTFAYPMHGKTGTEVLENMRQFLDDAGKVRTVSAITTDQGSEFTQNRMKKLLEENNSRPRGDPRHSRGIDLYLADVDDHQSLGIVDRVVKSLRTLMDRLMIANPPLAGSPRGRHNSKKYIEDFPALIENYNTRPHSTLSELMGKPTSPDDAYYGFTDFRKELISKLVAKGENARKMMEKLKDGDRVRILKQKMSFEKGQPHYSDEIYTIDGREGYAFILRNAVGNQIHKRYTISRLLPVESVEEKPSISNSPPLAESPEGRLQGESSASKKVKVSKKLTREIKNLK